MAEVTVNIVGGSEKKDTDAVKIGDSWWGKYQAIQFGEKQPVEAGRKELTVFKDILPSRIITWLEIPDIDVIVNISVNSEQIYYVIIPVDSTNKVQLSKK